MVSRRFPPRRTTRRPGSSQRHHPYREPPVRAGLQPTVPLIMAGVWRGRGGGALETERKGPRMWLEERMCVFQKEKKNKTRRVNKRKMNLHLRGDVTTPGACSPLPPGARLLFLPVPALPPRATSHQTPAGSQTENSHETTSVSAGGGGAVCGGAVGNANNPPGEAWCSHGKHADLRLLLPPPPPPPPPGAPGAACPLPVKVTSTSPCF